MKMAAMPASKPGEREGGGDDPVGADAHQPHGGEFARRGADGEAEGRAFEKQHQAADRDDDDGQLEDLQQRHRIGADEDGLAQFVEQRERRAAAAR